MAAAVFGCLRVSAVLQAGLGPDAAARLRSDAGPSDTGPPLWVAEAYTAFTAAAAGGSAAYTVHCSTSFTFVAFTGASRLECLSRGTASGCLVLATEGIEHLQGHRR